MIQEDFRDLVFDFAKEASKYGVLYVFLFGSIARGTADKRSDVDFLVVLDTIGKPEKASGYKPITKLAIDFTKKYDRNIQLLFTNRKFEGLDEYTIKQATREGIILFAPSPRVTIAGITLEQWSLIVFDISHLKASEKMKVVRALYGRKTIKKYKKKKYVSIAKGILEEIGGRKVAQGVVLVPEQHAVEARQALQRLGAKVALTEVWLSGV